MISFGRREDSLRHAAFLDAEKLYLVGAGGIEEKEVKGGSRS